MKMTSWRRRTHGSIRQIGKAFPIVEKKKLPKINFKAAKLVKPRTVIVQTKDLEFREWHPTNLEPRVQYFLELIKKNYPIAPIQVQQQKSGAYLVVDGHARTIAFRRAGIDKIQAVVIHPSKKRVGVIKSEVKVLA
jgi:hypothetical protein